MTHLLAKEIPNYDCLVDTHKRYPDLDPSSIMVFLHILRTGDEMFRAASGTFRKRNISQGRFMLMAHLFNKEEGESLRLSPAELADRLQVTRATVTGLVDGLVKDELVERSPDPQDRRMVLVTLTSKGIDLLNETLPEHYRLMKKIMADLSHDERDRLVELLGKVCDKIEEVCPREAEELNEIEV